MRGLGFGFEAFDVDALLLTGFDLNASATAVGLSDGEGIFNATRLFQPTNLAMMQVPDHVVAYSLPVRPATWVGSGEESGASAVW